MKTAATITAAQLASLLSLHVYASNDKVTPVLGLIQIQRHGHTLEATVTDRYCLAFAKYELNPDTHDDDTDEPVFVEATVAKQFLPMVKKAEGTAPVTIDAEAIRVAPISYGQLGVVIPLTDGDGRFKANSYPPVRKLIPDSLDDYAANPAGIVSLRPSYVAKLSKVILPGQGRKSRASAEDPWRFHVATRDDAMGNSKPAPVVCEPIAKDGGTVLVMIQPNMLTN